jgi:hypothetical protein
VIRHGIAEVAFLGAGDRRQPQHRGPRILDGIQPRSDIIEAVRAEEEWRHAIHNGAVEPGRALLGKLGGAGFAIRHHECGGALVGAAESVRDSQRDLVFALGSRDTEEQIFSSDGGIAQHHAVHRRERLRIYRAAAPLVSDDRRAARRGWPAGARVQQDAVVGRHDADPGLGYIAQANPPALRL